MWSVFYNQQLPFCCCCSGICLFAFNSQRSLCFCLLSSRIKGEPLTPSQHFFNLEDNFQSFLKTAKKPSIVAHGWNPNAQKDKARRLAQVPDLNSRQTLSQQQKTCQNAGENKVLPASWCRPHFDLMASHEFCHLCSIRRYLLHPSHELFTQKWQKWIMTDSVQLFHLEIMTFVF